MSLGGAVSAATERAAALDFLNDLRKTRKAETGETVDDDEAPPPPRRPKFKKRHRPQATGERPPKRAAVALSHLAEEE